MKKTVLRKKLWTLVLFLVKFNILAIPMYMALFLNLSYPPLQTFLTELTYKNLNLMGYHASLVTSPESEVQLIYFSDQFPKVQISWDSTGWKSMYALLALTLATPLPNMKGKFKFLLIGIPSIFLLNYLRIITTILISLNFGVQYFEIIHTLLWREGLILAVVAIWYLWLKKVKYNIGQK
jgi:exosortase/archaeosortase family protein